jgi:hypothetical protein
MASKKPETEQAIKEHCADAALRTLVTAGCEESTLLGGLSVLRDCDDSWEGLLGQAWPGFRGDSKKRLQSSIKKIRDCAAEIKRLESTPLWAMMLYVRSGYSPGSKFVPWSQALESYADTWSEVISKTGPKKHIFQAEAKAGFVAYVKEATGDWHDEEVSALIDVVMDKSSDAHAHLQWRSENEDSIRRLAEELRQTNHPESA